MLIIQFTDASSVEMAALWMCWESADHKDIQSAELRE